LNFWETFVRFGCATIRKEQLLEHMCNDLSLINNLKKIDNSDKYMIGMEMAITKRGERTLSSIEEPRE
jgi:hypothetical protein